MCCTEAAEKEQAVNRLPCTLLGSGKEAGGEVHLSQMVVLK